MIDMNISKDIINIGADDKDLKLFEGQYVLENGMSYNSYIIKDEKKYFKLVISDDPSRWPFANGRLCASYRS